jgi:hypothetical protein
MEKGSYYVRVRKTGWYVWYQHYVDGKRVQEPVVKTAYHELGFRVEMSVDQAKERCVQLNKERALTKEKVRLAAKRVESLKSLDDVLFPEAYITEFEALLSEENFGSDEHLRKLRSHFLFVQRMCMTLRISPFEYKDNARRIYKYFIKEQVSVNYSSRLIKLLNRWGQFYCRKAGKYYGEVKQPGGRERSAIADAQAEKTGVNTERGVRTESLPLAPAQLKAAKDKLTVDYYNWLQLSVWFGLRPEEVDGLKDPKRFKIGFHQATGVHFLEIYQTKLQSVASDKRWKKVPVIFEQQTACLEIIKEGSYSRPTYLAMRKAFGAGTTLYGGRKGFVDLMLSLGQNLENVSIWLGHKDISTTWEHYKDRDTLSFTPVTAKKRLKSI